MLRPATIVIVDDEVAVRQVLKDLFEAESFTVLEASSGEQLMSIMRTTDVDLVTLDLSLSAENGFDIVRQLRNVSAVGIILVSGKDELIDKVTGLELGADDYIAKPFQLREVLARVRSVLRRLNTSIMDSAAVDTDPTSDRTREPVKFVFTPWILCQATLELTHDVHGLCQLTTNEFSLLELFVSNPNQVLTRDQITDRLRGSQWSPTDRSVDNYIARIRRKLSEGESGGLIKTVRGRGYQFVASVTRQPIGSSESA